MKREFLALLVVVLAAFGCGNITRSCPPSTTDCGGDCVDIMTDNLQCGGCGAAACGNNQQCVAGSCQCMGGAKLCGSTCADTATDPANCGDCGIACTGGKTCNGGSCQCASNQMDCGGICKDTLTDEANCGMCGKACDVNTNCVAGDCGCPFAQLECGNPAACVDTATDEMNCGMCDMQCTGGKTCESSNCACTGINFDCFGTCVDRMTDNSNCGTCGRTCTGGKTCQSGDCLCTGTATDCNGTCVDMLTDNANCGMCNRACTGGKSCVSGGCQCPGGMFDCNGTCVDRMTDNNNCGMCGLPCTGGTTCQTGNCLCTGGLTNCSGTCTNLTIANNTHCGMCGRSCTGGKTCQGSPLNCFCPAGQTTCSDGACYDLTSDRTHCGSGCTVCTGAQLCNNGCTTASVLSIDTRWGTPTGWTVDGGLPIQMTFKLTPTTTATGITYECRTFKLGGVQPSFTNCDLASSGAMAIYKPPIGGDGSHRTEVRYLQNGVVVGNVVSFDYYAHNNLNGVAKCTPPFTDAQYFTVATNYATANATLFPLPAAPLFTSDAALKLDNPFITIPFKTVSPSNSMLKSPTFGGWGLTWPRNHELKELSLRHSYTLDSTGKLLLMKRNYVASVVGNCENLSSMHHRTLNFNFRLCEAYVLNINGKGLCIGRNAANTAPEVKGSAPYVAGWFRMRTTRYNHNTNGTTSTRYCGVVACQNDLNSIYLPP